MMHGGGGCFEYNEGYSVHRRVTTMMHERDIMIHVGIYHEYIGGCSGSQLSQRLLSVFSPT